VCVDVKRMTAARTRRSLLPVLVSVMALLALVVVTRGSGRDLSPAATGEAAGLTTAAGASPPVHKVAHPQRLLAAATPPAGTGGYALESRSRGQPVRWDPCQPIHYVISGTEPFTGANQMLTQALTEAGTRSGLSFGYLGTSTEHPSPHRASYQPDRYGRTWAPVLVAWTDQGAVPSLSGNVIGLGGAAAAVVRGNRRLVSGLLYFDAPELSLVALRADGYAEMRTVMLHEIGHLLGLGHVEDRSQVMYPSDGGQGDYGAGDLRGLALAGSGTCSHYS
jgi:hypothetical protein